MTSRWYRHRIVRLKVVSGARFSSDPGVEETLDRLTKGVTSEVETYNLNHAHCRCITSTFYKQVAAGLAVIVAATFYYPIDIEREITLELIEEGRLR